MGSIRYQTYHAGSYLVQRLQATGVMRKMIHDGGDIILFESYTGQTVSIHLIESGIPLYEIRNTLNHNHKQGYFTMFVLWTSMMLPHRGQRYTAEDWMEALYELNGGLIYGYDIIDSEVYVYPVQFHGKGKQRDVDYGTVVQVHQLKCTVVETDLPDFKGSWWVANFENADSQAELNRVPLDVKIYYEVLGVQPGDDAETVKRAYRLLARRYHPDTNTEPDANEQMQRINEAYRKIVDTLEE